MNKYGLAALALGLYVGAALVLTWPVAPQAVNSIAGTGGDPWQSMWRFADTGQQLRSAWQSGHIWSLMQTEIFGGGAARLVNLTAWPWMWLYALAGLPLTYNIVWLLSFVLSGFFVYLLMLHIFEHSGAKLGPRAKAAGAWLAGLMYAFAPFHAAHALGHFGAMQTEWLVLTILLWLLFLQRQTWPRVIGLALAVTMQAWTDQHYLVWFAILALITLVWNAKNLANTWRSRRGIILIVALAALLGGLVVVPYLPTTRLAQSNNDALALGSAQTERFSADLLAPLVPAPFHPLWGKLSARLFADSFTGNVSEATLYVGIMPLLLIAFFSQRVPATQKKIWWTIAGVFFVISLGPTLHVFGRVTGLPLPYALFQNLPVISAMRTVSRAGIMVILSLAVLFGWVIATQVKRFHLYGAIAGLVILEFLFIPVPMQSAQLSPVYAEVAQLPGQSIIEIPAATNYVTASRALYASTITGKNIVGSIALERGQDSDVLTEVRSLPALRQLIYLRTTHVQEDRHDFFDQELTETLPDVLKWLDVGAIIIHKDSVTPQQLATIRDFLEQDMEFTPLDFEDTLLYRVAVRATTADGIFLARDSRWQNVGFDPVRQSTFAEVPDAAAVNLYNASATTKTAVLRFHIAPESKGNFSLQTAGVAPLDLHKQGGEEVAWPVVLAPHTRTEVLVTNRDRQKLIIQDPQLEVLPPSV